MENHALIERMCRAIGIARYEQYSDHIRAVRLGVGSSLQIHWGWTDGFESEDEVLRATGRTAPYVQSDWRGAGFFYVEHPVNRLHEGGSGAKSKQRDFGTCPQCFLVFSALGVCDDCE